MKTFMEINCKLHPAHKTQVKVGKGEPLLRRSATACEELSKTFAGMKLGIQ